MFAEILDMAPTAVTTAVQETKSFGPGLGAGLAAMGGAIGAGLGIGRIGGDAGTGIARQPEAADAIKGNALLMAALVEGVALFAAVIGLMLYLNS